MEWSRGRTIGRGASATVSLATSTSGEIFAVKSADLSLSSSLQREKHFLSQLSSPHIVEYRGFEITEETNKPLFNLFIEYVPGGSISDEIKRQGGLIDESMIRFYTRQIVLGLNYLHSNGLVHCDIKGQNLLIGKAGIKIADLGCARWVEDGVPKSAFSGTPAFMAPEVARGEEQGLPADVWALGCTIIEMATGSNPWPEENDPVSALYRIGFSGDVPDFPTSVSDEARDFLTKCLEKDPRDRWTAKQLLHHPFIDDLELNSWELIEFSRNSPTSVLDQGIWNSSEVSEGRRDLTHMGSTSNSPAERIRCLVGGNSLSDSKFPNCTWDEGWVTVRERDIEENNTFSEQSDEIIANGRELIDTESYVFSAVNLDVVGNLIGISEDLSPEISVDTFSDLDCLYDSNSLFLCGIVINGSVPVANFLFKRKLMKLKLFKSSIIRSFFYYPLCR